VTPALAARFEPQILAIRRVDSADATAQQGSLRLELLVPGDLSYFEGHFAECALLPGVAQLHWAIRFGREHFALPPHFSYLSNVKFMRVITPGNAPQLTLDFDAARGELRFEYRVGESVCSSGWVGFSN